MIQYPLKFAVTTQAVSGIAVPWAARTSDQADIQVAIPVEFEGAGGGFSPEDFYALALTNCFVATFKVIAERSKLEFVSIATQGTLTVDRDEKGTPWMSDFKLTVTLNQPADVERATRLLEKTRQSCLILNSVRTKLSFSFEIT
ncbi:MAG: OsmC family peroxiredoxin [Proteobacteria bacterium]|nr:MAG: OsmC family peroxiredoxin [Pseudomonadota bacterium]